MEALKGITVLDLSQLGPGMYCTTLLAEFGADVINICPNRQNAGEALRIGNDVWSFEEQIKMIHASMDRSKKSVQLDLKSPADKTLFLKMVKKADVIVESFRPGVVKRLGIDYESMSVINPRIVYCSLSGYGQESSAYQAIPGHDINYIAMSGALDLIGEKGGSPIVPLFFLADIGGASLHSVIGILIALHARRKSGKGQYVDISYVGSVMTFLSPLAYLYMNYGIASKRGDTAYSGTSPSYKVYECSDGKYLAIGCYEPWFWKNLCTALSKEGYIPHQNAEGEKKEEILSALSRIFLERPRDEWFSYLKGKDVCVGKVNSLEEALNDPQIQRLISIEETYHETRGVEKHLGIPIRMSRTPARIKSAAPLRGEHTQEVKRKYKGDRGSAKAVVSKK